MSQYNVPFLSTSYKITNPDGTMSTEMFNFVKGVSDLFNNNFNATGLKVPDVPTEISNATENGTTWYNNQNNMLQVRVNGKTHNITTTPTSVAGVLIPSIDSVLNIEKPTNGQLVYDQLENKLKVYANGWKNLHS